MKKLIGYGYTNSSGVATLDYDTDDDEIDGYTGTGAGVMNFRAEMHDDSTVVSEPYPVIDSLFYDTGITGTDHNYYYVTNNTYELTPEYTLLTGEDAITLHISNQALNSNWNKIRKFSVNFCFEFDVVDATNMMCLIYYDDNGTDMNTIADTNFQLNRLIGHWKVEIKADGIYKNGTKVINATITKDISIGFQTPNRIYQEGQGRMLKFKNLVIYPI